MRATTSGLLLAAAVLATAAAPRAGSAQETPATAASTDARWQAWIGCWQPAVATGAMATRATCVLPAGPTAVELVTVEDGTVASRERIDASGEARAATREACAGTERAGWSPDGRRVYLRAEHTCDGVRFGSTGVMAFATADEWVDVRGASVAGGPADVRVRRYRPLLDTGVLPAALRAEAAAALGARPTVRAAARANAAADIVTAHVAEAARQVDAGVVEAWLIERGEGFDLDAKQLVALADAGVPERVIDVVVALTYPSRFAINGVTRGVPSPAVVAPGATDTVRTTELGLDRRSRYCRERLLPSSYCDDYVGYGMSPFALRPYGLSPWDADPYGYGYGYGYYGRRPPVIVITDPNAAPAQRGRVVNGKGYTRRGESSGGDGERATPRTRSATSSSSGDRASTRSGSSSGSSRSGGESRSSGGSSESGRKAKPRSP